VEKQTGSEKVRKLNQLRTNFEPAPVLNQVFFWWKRGNTDHWMFNMETHGKELSKDLRIRIVTLHKDCLGYKKIGNTLKQVFQDGLHSEQVLQRSIK